MIQDTRGDKIFNGINITLLTIFLILVLYPLIYVISASFSSASALVSGKVYLWPVHPTLVGYQTLLGKVSVWRGYLNSIIYTVSYIVLSCALTILAAYPLSRKDFAPRNAIMMIFSFTMWFSGGMIPSYLLVRDLHMLDSMWAIIIPGAMGVYNTIITRTFFQSTIPESLLESAKLDGCSDFTFLIRIVLPLSMAIIAVVALYTGVGMWNSYMSAFLYLQDRRKMPLQIVLREILLMNQIAASDSEMTLTQQMINSDQAQELQYLSELLKYSLIVVSSLPLMIAYPFLQKYFMQGILIGSIKG